MADYKGHVVLTTGSREFDRQDLILAELKELPKPTWVMHGGAKGSDRMIADAIQGRRDGPQGIPGLVEIRVPYISTEQKRGGYKRNEVMLQMLVAFRDQGYDCWAIAFHYDIERPSPGTKSMVELLTKEDFQVIHIDGMK